MEDEEDKTVIVKGSRREEKKQLKEQKIQKLLKKGRKLYKKKLMKIKVE